MTQPSLETLDPKSLVISSNDRDILYDLFAYLDYVDERSVKRMTRSNELPRADLQRLAKLMGIAPPEKNGGVHDRLHWIYFIDDLALRLKLVSYDLKGVYRGYTSSEPSFIENYIDVNVAEVDTFLELPPIAQEKRILDTLVHAKSHNDYDDSSYNEFFGTSMMGELDAFYRWGASTGLMPTLKFPEIRLFLLDVLKSLPAGQWFSTESLIHWLKANHPYFLIPRDAPKKDKWGHPVTRYGNFYEGKDHWSHNEKPIPDNATDGFERVEGRYIERFLENIPLTMRFVDVAYDPEPYTGLYPMRDMLKAFRVHERFLRLMSGEAAIPKVTVQPNFDIVVESDFYPVRLVRQVASLGEPVSNQNSGHSAYVGIFHLTKAAVAAAQVEQPDLDVIALLKGLGGRDLPPNVQTELDEWAGHADQFTLYEGFGLLETLDTPLDVKKLVVEKISPSLWLVRRSEKVFTSLETLGHVPVRVQHLDSEFTLVAGSAASVFPKEPAAPAPKVARQVKVSRTVIVSYQFPDDDSFDSTQKMLAELRCPFQSDPNTRTVSLQQNEQAKFDEALAKLAGEYVIEVDP